MSRSAVEYAWLGFGFEVKTGDCVDALAERRGASRPS